MVAKRKKGDLDYRKPSAVRNLVVDGKAQDGYVIEEKDKQASQAHSFSDRLNMAEKEFFSSPDKPKVADIAAKYGVGKDVLQKRINKKRYGWK